MRLRPIWVAGRFLSRLPFPDPGTTSAQDTGASVPWYPLIGLAMGAVTVLVATLAAPADAGVAAALALAAWAWSTGGLHLDGLADTADAWIGGLGNRERTLEIMKDPRCGPAAVSTLALLLILKWSALAALIAHDQVWLVLWIPAIGRAQLLLLLLTTPYARKKGMASDQFNELPRQAAWASVAITGLGVILTLGLLGIGYAAAALGCFFLARRNMVQRIGGFTGDTAGALAELTEAALVVIAVIYVAH